MHFCAHNVLQNFQFIFIKFRMLPDPTDLLKSMFSMYFARSSFQASLGEFLKHTWLPLGH